MYDIQPVNGMLAIERDGQIVLSVCDPDWEFTDWFCTLVSNLGSKPLISLTQQDLEWLKALDSAFGLQAHHA